MDAIFNYVGRYITLLLNELGQIASRIDGGGWACLSAVLLVLGWFWLKGDKVKGA